ncbi:hypothetical protein DLREEDagrD3_16830 [Denitratisoma sp. agr-D3]
MDFWQKLRALLGPTPPMNEAIVHGITHAIEVVDPVLNVVGGVVKTLEPAVATAMAYCAELVAQLPPAISINRSHFATDPMVHAMFASADDIDVMLGRSTAMREFLAEGDNAFADDCYALVGMRQNQKTVLGMVQQGDVIQSDVPRQYLYFSDHTLRELSSSEEITRHRLQLAAFDSLVHQFADQMVEKRKCRDELHAAWNGARANGGGETTDERMARLHELEVQYQESTASLAPERVVEQLAAWLSSPAEHIRLEPWTATVDRMGALVDADDGSDSEVCTLQCPLLVGRDRRRWLVMLVRISRAEALEAVAAQMKLQEASRYLLV